MAELISHNNEEIIFKTTLPNTGEVVLRLLPSEDRYFSFDESSINTLVSVFQGIVRPVVENGEKEDNAVQFSNRDDLLLSLKTDSDVKRLISEITECEILCESLGKPVHPDSLYPLQSRMGRNLAGENSKLRAAINDVIAQTYSDTRAIYIPEHTKKHLIGNRSFVSDVEITDSYAQFIVTLPESDPIAVYATPVEGRNDWLFSNNGKGELGLLISKATAGYITQDALNKASFGFLPQDVTDSIVKPLIQNPTIQALAIAWREIYDALPDASSGAPSHTAKGDVGNYIENVIGIAAKDIAEEQGFDQKSTSLVSSLLKSAVTRYYGVASGRGTH